MSRDHYKGIPKKVGALVTESGDIEGLSKRGDTKRVVGTVTIAAGTATVNDERFVSGGYALLSPQHPYPITEGWNWAVGDGYLTISGSTGANYVFAYEVILP
jgi:hypothetical protein